MKWVCDSDACVILKSHIMWNNHAVCDWSVPFQINSKKHSTEEKIYEQEIVNILFILNMLHGLHLSEVILYFWV